MDRVRARVKDKRVLMLVKAFLKAGVMTETGHLEDNPTGTPQGGVLSPLLANIALNALDQHVHGPWRPGGAMSSPVSRALRRRRGLPNWRIVRFADDFVVLVFGSCDDTKDLREEIADVLAPLGLRFSEAKTRVVHMSEGFDFLGFRLQWKRKRGTDKWYVYTFIADRPIRSLKEKIRALTSRLSQQPTRDVLRRLNQIMRGWSNYFRYAVAKKTMQTLAIFVWRRVARWWMRLHRWSWTDLRRHLTGHTGRWQWRMPSADGVELFNLGRVPTERYRYRGNKIPNPWILANHA
jgi:RNA-directed DNA polymerase